MITRPDSPHEVLLDLSLHETDLDSDPMKQFARWFAEASSSGLRHPEGMLLSTVSERGCPSARIVLMKEFDARGFVFFTNYESHKSRELSANPQAALTFWWDPLERQVRVEGEVERVTPEESDAYFQSRPRGSQIGAWASRQSAVIADRDMLESETREIEERFGGVDVPRPPFWGGWRLVPRSIEFWQGRRSRLHDRLRYRRVPNAWLIERLSP